MLSYLSRLLALLLVTLLGSSALAAEAPQLSTGAGMTGVGFYRDQTWGLIRSQATNPTNQAWSPLLAISFDARPDRQFARRVWLPAYSQRTVLTPVRPFEVPADARSVEVSTLLVDDRGGSDDRLGQQPGLLLVRRDRFFSGIMADSGDDAAMDASTALRLAAGLERSTSSISSTNAPPIAAGWEGLDGLMISRHDPALSPEQLQALRQWVFAGGRLWIMLDQVDPAWPRQLLGDAWPVTVIDRVWLHEFAIAHVDPEEHEPLNVAVDYPLEMVRVLAPGAQTIQTVRGYPASLRFAAGQGEVLVTTVHAAAWTRTEVTEKEADPATGATEPTVVVQEVATEPLEDLTWFKRPEGEPAAPTLAAFEPFLREQIGYTILSRGPVLAVLGGFAVVLLGAGLWLARRDRLEYMGALGAVGAVAAAALLIGIGLLHQSDKPLTIAAAQYVEPVADQNYARLQSLIGIYTPATAGLGDMTLRGGEQGIAWPDRASQASGLLRMVWTGLERWEIPDMPLPPNAVETLRVEQVVPLDEPMAARLHFTDQGLEGSIEQGPFTDWSDAVLATRGGRLAAQIDGEGAVQATLADRLEPGQFVRAGVLSQGQMSRQEVYRRLFENPAFPAQPALLAWTRGLGTGLELTGEAQQRAQSLVVLPVTFERPAPGTRITIPAMLLPMDRFTGAGSSYSGTIYDAKAGDWVRPISTEMGFLMRFDLPEAVLPFDVEEATLRLDLKAPGRPVEVLVFRNGQVESVRRFESPVSPMEITLSGDDAPEATDGGVAVGLRVGPPLAGPGAGNVTWSLFNMELDLAGAVEAAPPAPATAHGDDATQPLAMSGPVAQPLDLSNPHPHPRPSQPATGVIHE